MRKTHRKRSKKPLTDQMRRAAQLWYDGHKTGQIAAEIGINRTTLWRWSHRADFQREINRIADKWTRDYRRKTLKEMHNSPEYKRKQNQKYYARQRLKILEQKLQAAGESGNMKAYRAATREYDKCISIAYFDGLSAAEYLKRLP